MRRPSLRRRRGCLCGGGRGGGGGRGRGGDGGSGGGGGGGAVLEDCETGRSVGAEYIDGVKEQQSGAQQEGH
jgi:hypothetical protein